MPVSTTTTAVSDGMPPIFSLMPIATGVVTDFGASEAMVAVDAPSSQAMSTAETSRDDDADQQADRQREPGSAQFRELVEQRHRQRDGGRAEQEVHELCAFEIGRVRRARGHEQEATSSSTAIATGLTSGLKRLRSYSAKAAR